MARIFAVNLHASSTRQFFLIHALSAQALWTVPNMTLNQVRHTHLVARGFHVKSLALDKGGTPRVVVSARAIRLSVVPGRVPLTASAFEG